MKQWLENLAIGYAIVVGAVRGVRAAVKEAKCASA